MGDLKEKTKKFLSELEGYHQLCKMLHWSTTCMAEHKLIDDIDHSLLSYQDKFAEAVMGNLNIRFGIGDLNTLLPSAKNLDGMLDELKTDLDDFNDGAPESIDNISGDLYENIDTWKYLKTFK